MGNEPTINEPSIKKEKEHLYNVKIPDECLDPDGGPCPHEVKEVKKHYNPV